MYSGWKESFSFHIATGFGERNCFRERYPVEEVEGFEVLDSKRGRCFFSFWKPAVSWRLNNVAIGKSMENRHGALFVMFWYSCLYCCIA